jgi:hypothetical protein
MADTQKQTERNKMKEGVNWKAGREKRTCLPHDSMALQDDERERKRREMRRKEKIV